jgi:hypothetical protein
MKQIGHKPYFFMAEEMQNIIPDLTDAEEVRKAVIASEILTRKY